MSVPCLLRTILTGLLASLLAAQPVYAQAESSAEKSPRLLVHLLDYLSSDYGGAVENGQVKSSSEYKEQMEFVTEADALAKQLHELDAHPSIKEDVGRLHSLISHKADANQVADLARKIQQSVVQVAGITLAPKHWPNVQMGAKLFESNCMSCHGSQGRGDGSLASSYIPPPANLQAEKMDDLSPFQVFNTIRLGVPGTAMQPHAELSDRETWDLAFFVISLRHSKNAAAIERARFHFSDLSSEDSHVWLARAASTSDHALLPQIPGIFEEQKLKLSYLRLRMPSEDEKDFLGLARANIDEASNDFSAGRFSNAEGHALSAYLDGIEPVEAKLRANSPELVIEIETSMAAFRSSLKSTSSLAQISSEIDHIHDLISKADAILQNGKSSYWFVFSAAAGILLREGLEAVLFIVALLGVMGATGARRAAWWVHGGWTTALGVGALLWIFSGWVMNLSGAHRETLEGTISLLAVVVLLYLGFWLHRKTEIQRWQHFIAEHVKTALENRSLVGLAAISFFAVFREVCETVLFLRAVSLEGGSETQAALWLGVSSAFVLVLVLSWVLLRYSRRLPLRRLFSVTSLLMIGLAIVITGKGLHSLQESGWVAVNPVPFRLRVDLLGFYPTIQTLAAQIIMLLVCWALWFWARRPSRTASLTHLPNE